MGNLVIISGASTGLGLALAESTPFPARIIDISRSGPPTESGIEHLQSDLSESNDWPRLVTALRDLLRAEGPSRSVFIHAAGTLTPIGFAGEVDDCQYANNILVNSAAGQMLGHAYLSVASELAGAHDLIMISSGAASNTYPGWSSYGAGKAALDQWVRYVGKEQAIRGGVRVCAIAPGVLDTEMQSQIRAMSEEDFPDVERFRELHEEGDLVSPAAAASKLWSVLQNGVQSGLVIDLRDL